MRSSLPRATIKTIAADCGVSAQTVSRIANGLESLHKPETVRKVREAMDRLGFLPDSSARSMRSGRTGVVALLQQADGGSYLPFELLDGISSRLESLGFQLNFARAEVSADGSLSYLPKILRERRADALLVNINGCFSRRLEDEISSKGFPSVWLNVDKPFDCVRPDDFMASWHAAQYLIKQGVGGAFYAHSSPSFHFSARERKDGASKALSDAGLKFDSLVCDAARKSLLLEDFASHFRKHGIPSSIIGYTVESLAVAVNAVAAIVGHEAASKIPRATFGPATASSFLMPAPFLEIPFSAMGVAAVDLLASKLSGASEPAPCLKIPFADDFKIFEC